MKKDPKDNPNIDENDLDMGADEESVEFEKVDLKPDENGLKEAESEEKELDVENFDKVDDYYSDDVEAAVSADENRDPDKLKEEKEVPVTSGEMELGDLDAVPDSPGGDDALYGSDDEEDDPDFDVDEI